MRLRLWWCNGMESIAVVIVMEDMNAVRKERISLLLFSLSPSLSPF